MNDAQVDFVTLKPKWSLTDLFTRPDEETSRQRILAQLKQEYLANGWELADEIYWGKRYSYAVMKLGRTGA